MINTLCGRRFPEAYRVEPLPDALACMVRRGNGLVLAEFEERVPEGYVPAAHLRQPLWDLRKGWNMGDVLRALSEDIEAERLGAMDREAHKRMKATALNRRRRMVRHPVAGRLFL